MNILLGFKIVELKSQKEKKIILCLSLKFDDVGFDYSVLDVFISIIIITNSS